MLRRYTNDHQTKTVALVPSIALVSSVALVAKVSSVALAAIVIVKSPLISILIKIIRFRVSEFIYI